MIFKDNKNKKNLILRKALNDGLEITTYNSICILIELF